MIGIVIRVILQKLVELKFLNFLFAYSSVQMAEYFDVPSWEPQFFHEFVWDNEFFVHRTSYMKRSLASIEVTLNTSSLWYGANVAFELKSLVIELPTENT